MKVLILGDIDNQSQLDIEVKNRIIALFAEQNRKIELKYFEIDKDEINHCIGCFSCWVKTPGICIFDDIGRIIAKEYMQSDIVIIVTPIRYGCYSVAIRRIWDRLLPNMLPFFRKIKSVNEVHHVPRYDHYPELLVIGHNEIISDFEKDTFKALTDANALNFMREEAKTYICQDADDIELTVNSLKRYLQNGGAA